MNRLSSYGAHNFSKGLVTRHPTRERKRNSNANPPGTILVPGVLLLEIPFLHEGHTVINRDRNEMYICQSTCSEMGGIVQFLYSHVMVTIYTQN